MTLDLAKIKSDAEIIASRCDTLLMPLPVKDVLAMLKEIERSKRMMLAAACDIGAIGEALGADMDADGDAIKGLAIDLRQDKERLDWLDGKANPVVGGQTASDPEGEVVAIRWSIDGCCNTVREAIDYEVEHG